MKRKQAELGVILVSMALAQGSQMNHEVQAKKGANRNESAKREREIERERCIKCVYIYIYNCIYIYI